MRRILFFVFSIVFSINLNCAVYEININKPIMPPVVTYVSRVISMVNENDVVIIKIDTQGGLVVSAEKIIKKILSTKAITVAFISPKGGGAVSAGSFIAVSCDKLVMLPSTRIGAAHPYSPISANKNILEEKIVNDLLAFLKSVNELKNKRPFEPIEKMITESKSYGANEAVKVGVCDFTVETQTDLLNKISGEDILLNGKTRKVPDLKSKKVKIIKMSLKESILSTIFNPDIDFMLLALGIVGIIIEIATPGFGIPGVTGLISLIAALYGLSIMPLNYTGILFLISGVFLFVLEILGVGGGILAVGGSLCFALGGFYLIDNFILFNLTVSISSIIIVLLSFIILFFFVISAVIESFKLKKMNDSDNLIGLKCIAQEDFNNNFGVVKVNGESWTAVLKGGNNITVTKNSELIIDNIQGNKLIVLYKRED